MVVDVLKREIEDLAEREGSLTRVNDALVEAVTQQQHALAQESSWKAKCQAQSQINR
jgi:hypothetical protein